MSVVIAIRGSNGAGKTTVARRVMDATEKDFVKKVKASNGVLLNVYKKYVIIGSYDRVCGGADTVKTPQLVWDAVVEAAEFTNVLYEGALVGSVFEPVVVLNARLKQLGAKFIPVCLNPTLEECIANVNTRRAADGKPPLPDPKNIETNYKKHISSAKKLHAIGLEPHWVSSDEAVPIILKELGYE